MGDRLEAAACPEVAPVSWTEVGKMAAYRFCTAPTAHWWLFWGGISTWVCWLYVRESGGSVGVVGNSMGGRTEVGKMAAFYELFCFATPIGCFTVRFLQQQASSAMDLGWVVLRVLRGVWWNCWSAKRRLGLAVCTPTRWSLDAVFCCYADMASNFSKLF